jgi:hypothetical protein
MDWLSRLFEMMPVRGRVDLRCLYGAPWRIEQGPAEVREIPYHAVVSGSALLDDPGDGRPLELKAGDILLLPGNLRHVLHDRSGTSPAPARNRSNLNLIISENAGAGEWLDMLCGILFLIFDFCARLPEEQIWANRGPENRHNDRKIIPRGLDLRHHEVVRDGKPGHANSKHRRHVCEQRDRGPSQDRRVTRIAHEHFKEAVTMAKAATKISCGSSTRSRDNGVNG